MKHCKHCNVDVNDMKDYCPLCFDRLEGERDDVAELYLQRTENRRAHKNNYIIRNIFLFMAICTLVVCTFIDYQTGWFRWSLIVDFSVLYVWILVDHTIISRRSAFEKIFFQLVGVLCLLLSVTVISKGDWLIPYVLPSIMLATTTVLVFILMISRSRNLYVGGFFIMFLLLTLVSVVLVFAGFSESFTLLNNVNILYSGLTALGTLIFGARVIKSDLERKFHLG